ncbi:MAG: hypothetical protein K2L12_01180 [Clostridia bacterium]|nr:hypothetical protein [Clostridia bacterium]
MKKFKIIFVSILSVIVACMIFLYGCGRPTIKNELKYWQNSDYSQLLYGSRLNELLPAFEENNNCISAKFYYHQGCLNFDYAEAAYCLELNLNESDYNRLKESAERNYHFIEETTLANGELTLNDYKINNFDISFIKINEKFANEIGLVSFDASDSRIRYCYIVSMSLDYFEDETDLTNWITDNLAIGW